MTSEQKALAKHRFERAETTLKEAIDELSRSNFRLAVNRAYYSVFYAMRAFLATINKDSSKHSGVISLLINTLLRQVLFLILVLNLFNLLWTYGMKEIIKTLL